MGMPGNNVAGVEIVKPNQPMGALRLLTRLRREALPFGAPPAAAATPPAGPDPNELKPNAQPDPNELKPVDSGTDQALPPPAQVNEIHSGPVVFVSPRPRVPTIRPASDKDISSSKKKKKKGLKKIVPF